ncbi:hypothetical protein CORC01_04397 [Colletotrichum orchidophilum]|uniref:Uncharacterized protein n=1 Tax=Colletotrichum orchidophilum TaxID=1209926 RepID=A0A1G4BFT0_9PEZI|nr:uncharacterized protein CORC01_04397 [Colletotrichum orchidophilum]OHF00208.1 hypothetical protein CORC01_04397 [Colletotrichum orchidophilum]
MQIADGGFTPINVPKRPLTPTSSVAISSPLKRLAVDASIGSNVFDQHCPPPDLVQTPPSPSEAAVEIPETPSTTSAFSATHVTAVESEAADFWMNQFVNLDKVGGEGFVPVTELPGQYHGTASETLSNVDGVPLKPFPELNVDLLAQSSPKSEDTIEDTYGLEELDEEELAQLFEDTGDKAPCIPSSSIIQRMARDSRSASSFDSKLQFSEPDTGKFEASKADLAGPDLLDEDVDWDLVTECAANAADVSPDHNAKSSVESKPKEAAKAPSSLAPFVRPPFPAKTRDRSVVFGLSSAMMMRTCFRIGELLNAHAKCNREKQDVILELFAKVVYANRENMAKVQHFQLQDLFTGRQPFLSGAFKGWKSGGPMDDQIKVFLGPDGKNKLCRCVCKLSDDKKATTRRSATILSIRETTWDEIQWAMRIVARDGKSDNDIDNEGMTSQMI